MTTNLNLDDYRIDLAHEEPSRWLVVPPQVLQTLERRARHQQDLPRSDPKLVASEHGGYQVHLWGEIGEWAVAHRLGLPMHRLHAAGGDGHIDFTLPEGRTLAVKATPSFKGRLLFRDVDAFTTDIAALTYVREEPKRYLVYIEGWITRTQFLKRCEKFEPGRLGTEVCVRPGVLSPIGSLAAWIDDRRTRP